MVSFSRPQPRPFATRTARNGRTAATLAATTCWTWRKPRAKPQPKYATFRKPEARAAKRHATLAGLPDSSGGPFSLIAFHFCPLQHLGPGSLAFDGDVSGRRLRINDEFSLAPK